MRALLASILLTLLAAVSFPAEGMNDRDRQRLRAHLDMTEAMVLGELDGVTAPQLKYRMTPDSWSIKDVVEHLAIGEAEYWQRLQESLKQPKPARSTMTDADILWYGIDRTNREQAVKADLPDGRWNDVKDAVAEFRKLRLTMKSFARTTTEDLRSRQLQNGVIDVYQWFLMISTHAQRHVLQIREIKAHSGYPRA
jgi:DinB superfamily